MKIGFNVKARPAAQTAPKAGQAELQWKCSENHPDCAARHWQHYSFVPIAEAAALVARYNLYTNILKYRVKP